MVLNKLFEATKQILINAGNDILNDFQKGINFTEIEDKEEKINYKPPNKYYSNKGIKFGEYKRKDIKFEYGNWNHKIIVGATGAGKSTWAENYVINCNHGICFIDNARGESADKILKSLPQKRLEKTVVLDHSDKEKPLAVGVFKKIKDIFESDIITNQWLNFIISNFDIEDKYRTQMLLKNACKSVFSLDNGTLLDVVKILENVSYRDKVISRLPIMYEDVKAYFNKFDNMSENIQRQYIDPILNRLGIMTSDTNLKTTLGQIPKQKLEYKKWMDEGYTVIIKVPEKKLTTVAVKCITALHVLSFWQASLERDDVWNYPEKQFTIIADEPQSWLGNNEQALDNIFSKARKNRLNIFCLIQSFKQIKKESSVLLDIILDNKPDIISFAPYEEIEELKQWYFIAKIKNDKFIAKSSKPAKEIRSDKQVKQLINKNKHMYNKSYIEVLQNIKRRYNTEWGGNVSTKGKKEELQKNTLKQESNTESQKRIKKSSDSSIDIDW
ncbi:MAG: hypothetical protein ACOC2W_03320 [bacterium]